MKWTPGNGKAIKIWIGHRAYVSLIVLTQAFLDLRQKLEGVNVHMLFDLSNWASNGRWTGWLELGVDHLNDEYLSLITVMPTPVHRTLKNERCWGKS